MTPRVKLLTLWAGPLPDWLPRFEERVRAVECATWRLLHFRDHGEANAAFTAGTRVSCRKGSSYAVCDLRPALALAFPEEVKGFDWWGWCDLDVVLGDLDSLLVPLLGDHDVVSAEPNGIAGCLTVLRNCSAVDEMCDSSGWERAAIRSEYCNFDENGREEGLSFTDHVRASGLRCHFDGRSFAESWGHRDGVPLRTCRTDGKRVFQRESHGRGLRADPEKELLLYHFSLLKRWPE